MSIIKVYKLYIRTGLLIKACPFYKIMLNLWSAYLSLIKGVYFILAFILLYLVNIVSYPVFAADKASSSNSNEWTNSKGEYEFPITVDSKEWSRLGSAVQMRAVTQIPDEILETISTEDLISL